MKKTRVLVLLILSTFLSLTAFAQTEIEMDLALLEEGETSVEAIDAGEAFVVVITNRLPKERYTVKTERVRETIKPLTLQQFAGDAGAPTCANVLRVLETALDNATTEQEVGDGVNNARITADGCADAVKASVEKAIEIKTTVSKNGPKSGLDRGESFLVTVSRGTGDDQKKWIYKITTGAAGEFRVLYGFNFVPDNDEHFFLRENATTAGTYDIVEETDDNDFSFVPTIFASWQANRPGPVSWGLSGGLGFDAAKPIVFVGPTVVFRENISLNFGLVMQERQRLDPQIDRTKTLPSLIDNAKLHRTDGYRPNWFIGIGFRFDENPFKAKKPAEEESEEE